MQSAIFGPCRWSSIRLFLHSLVPLLVASLLRHIRIVQFGSHHQLQPRLSWDPGRWWFLGFWMRWQRRSLRSLGLSRLGSKTNVDISIVKASLGYGLTHVNATNVQHFGITDQALCDVRLDGCRQDVVSLRERFALAKTLLLLDSSTYCFWAPLSQCLNICTDEGIDNFRNDVLS